MDAEWMLTCVTFQFSFFGLKEFQTRDPRKDARGDAQCSITLFL